MASTSPDFADQWQDGLFSAVDGLALFPKRYAIIPESDRFQMPVRRMNYGRGRGVYQALYHLTDEDGDGQEDTVHILHVQHSSRPVRGQSDTDEGQE